jgi:hypothetical protein
VDRQADRFDDAYRLCIALARITIVDEVQKRRFAHHAVQLHLPSALEGNFLQRPREQIIEGENGASASVSKNTEAARPIVRVF